MLRFNVLGILLLTCVLSSWGQRKMLSPEEAAALKQRVTEQTKQLRSLESTFTQTKHLDYLENDVTSSGKLYFKAPDKIRWEYVRPSSYTVIFNGELMRMNEGEKKAKQIDLASNRRMKGLNALLTGTVQGGRIFDDTQFQITYYREGADYSAILVPKDQALSRYIKQVELTLDGRSYLVRQIKITDPTQDYTRITFDTQRQNVSLPESLF